MSDGQVRTYHYLLERAFRRGEHALLPNLEGVTEQEWLALPPGHGRCIGDIAWHAAAGKHLYWDAAFGTGTLTGDHTSESVAAHGRSMADVLAYAQAGQEKLLAALDTLDDAGLDEPRRLHWGESKPTSRIFAALIEHDLYHAGEINLLRSLLHGTDRWPG